MNKQGLLGLLEEVRAGEISVERAVERLKHWPYEDLGFARVDHHRALRQGRPEVLYGEGKTPGQIVDISRRLMAAGSNVLVTRVDEAKAAAVRSDLPESEHHPLARLLTVKVDEVKADCRGTIAVFCAGTSDVPVAEEARLTIEMMGHPVKTGYDVGVAGLHRLLGERETLEAATVFVVVAGMEGALPSVVGGLVDRPVVAVPTSVGYGTSFGGLAALLGMLNSCAAGVSVVNIDNGFGAGVVAAMINRA
ncbi:MAG: nickel pincer cofactor biosynthesis protein LarB [Proteobacteria bacterium]|nr:nickel pincer cofactor biosynthesis protein LarB [Pseudomonadota bacterium]MBU1740859.1 nickel pincer cofactor biosynthesis protein LarB [Pseudomonadota bacterium]